MSYYWQRGENADEHRGLLAQACIRHCKYKTRPWSYTTILMTDSQRTFCTYLDRTDWRIWLHPLLWEGR